MSIAFSCTNCGKSFRVPDKMAGKKGKCPQCDAVFRIPAESKAKKPKKDNAFAFDAPGAALEDFSADVAASGAPAAPPPPQGSGSGKMMFLVYGFVFLVVAGTVGAAIVFQDKLIVPPTINSDLKFMPDDCAVLVAFNLSNTRASAAFDRLKQELNGFDPDPHIAQYVQILKPEEIHRLTVGAAPGQGPPKFIVVLRSKEPMYPGDVKKVMEGEAAKFRPLNLKEEEVGPYKMYADADWAFALPNEKTLVTGFPADVKAVLQRNKRPRFSTPMAEAMRQIDFDKAALALVLETGPVAEAAQAAGKAFAPAVPSIPQEQVATIQAFGLEIDLAAGMALKSIAVCNDAKTAKNYAEESNDKLPGIYHFLAANADGGKTLAPVIQNTKTKTRKNILIVTTSVTANDLAVIAKEIQKGVEKAKQIVSGGGMPPDGAAPPNPDAPKKDE